MKEEKLGNILGLSCRQVQRFLKKNYGKTFAQMKREACLNKAVRLMRDGMSMDEVAAETGYNTPDYLRKILGDYGEFSLEQDKYNG